MKVMMVFALLFLSQSYAAVPLEDAVCYSNMSDGDCKLTESGTTFDARCTIDVTLTLKSGEKVPVVIEGNSSIKKNQYALLLNDMLKERAMGEAYGNLSEKIAPFVSMEDCD